MPFKIEDMDHVNTCKICRNMMIFWIGKGKQPLSEELMTAIRTRAFREEVIRAVCLRAAHLPTEENTNV